MPSPSAQNCPRNRRLGTGGTSAMTANPQTGTAFEPVPQLDLAAQYAAVGAEVRAAVERVITSQQFILGREGAALEREIAAHCAVAHPIAIPSRTDAPLPALPPPAA